MIFSLRSSCPQIRIFQAGPPALQEAKDEYGNADIHLNVTFTAGAVSTNDNGGVSVAGTVEGAINVVVTDLVATGKSDRNGNVAISFVNGSSDDKEILAHEMAHQFTGDTAGSKKWLNDNDPFRIANAFADFANNFERTWMNHVDKPSGPLSHYPLASVFNHDAAVFQKSIQPTTKPQ